MELCLCSGHSILVNFSETSHVTVICLDVLYKAHSGLYRENKCFLNHHISLKMAIFNLVKNCTSLWKYDYILQCLLNLNNFQIVCHKTTSQENVMGFQIQIWLPVMKQDIISYMFNVEDTRTKMFIMHFGRQQLNREKNYISVCLWNIIYYYENLAMYYSHSYYTFCPNSNTLISKLYIVYRYTVFNRKPVYGIFYTHIA